MTRDLDELIAVLAPASGLERARRVVEQSCAELGIKHPPSVQQIPMLVTHLSEKPGAVGAAIRLAARRSAATPAGGVPAPNGVANKVSLVQLLATALGEEKAKAIVKETAEQLRLDPDRLTLESEARILDRLANGTDYLATVARFAKTRTLLKR